MSFWKILSWPFGHPQRNNSSSKIASFELEDLEPRYLLSTFTVVNTANSGTGSLRAAIAAANAATGADRINFAIGSGNQTIQPLSELPRITDALFIDGTSQPGFAGEPLIELDGSLAGAGSNGLYIVSSNSVVRGLVINRFNGQGIRISTGSSNVVQGSYIGTDASGTVDLGNASVGVLIRNSAGNKIGGTVAGQGNLISGNNLHGVKISGSSADDNRLQGNLIGTDISGKLAVGNSGSGVTIVDGSVNRIGSAAAGAFNVISGNGSDGVAIFNAAATSNLVQGNFIGTNIDGTEALGNARRGITIVNSATNRVGGSVAGSGNVISGNSFDGVSIQNAFASGNLLLGNLIGTDAAGLNAIGNGRGGVLINGAPSNTIGGSVPNTANTISGNTLHGVFIRNAGATNNLILGNRIGADKNGAAALANGFAGVYILNASSNQIGGTSTAKANILAFNQGDGVTVVGNSLKNSIRGNSIFSNLDLGIDLANDGVTTNDAGDADSGPNNLQNFPVLVSATKNGSDVDIVYNVDAATGTFPLRVEFFLADSLGEEGKTFLGFNSYTAANGTAGNKSITLTPLATVLAGKILVATATDVNGNTSEFSTGIQVSGGDTALNDPPVIAFNRPANVDEAGTVTITTFNLEAADPDDSGTGLTYELISPLLHGTLKVNGSEESEFTQAEIDANLVTYTHDGSETTSDFFDFTLRDGGEDGAAPDFGTFNITINPINDPPTIIANNTLGVATSGSATITTAYLNGFDPDDSGTGLTYSVTSGPANGQLELTTNPGVPITSFTQADLNNNRVKYVNNGTPNADSFGFSLADGGEDGAFPATGTFNIDVGPNDQPIIAVNNGATVNEGGLVTIDNTKLQATDPDDFGVGLTFTLTAGPSNGALRLNGGPLVAGDPLRDKFTQADIDNGLIKYLHNGSETTVDSFNFSMADGGEDGTVPVFGTFNITINPVNQAPTLAVNTGATVGTGNTIIITNAMLNEGDPDDSGTGVIYFFSNVFGVLPAHGTLKLNGVTIVLDTTGSINGEFGGAPDSFTQDDIDNNLVTYVHDGGASTLDSFTFILQDDEVPIGFQASQPDTFTIVVDNPGNDAPVLANIESSQLQFTKGSAAIQITSSINVADGDDTNMESAVVRISNNFQVGDQLLFTDALGVSGSYNAATGVLTLTGTASKAAYQGLLRTIQFVNNNAGVTASLRTIEFVVNDGDDNSNAQTRDINVVLGSPPTLDLDADDSTGTGESLDSFINFNFDGAVNLTSGCSIVDTDSANMASATITLTNHPDGTNEFLGITQSLADTLGITVAFSNNNHTITLTGSKTKAQYVQLLDTVTYNNTAPDNYTNRIVDFVVNDGGTNSEVAHANVFFPPS